MKDIAYTADSTFHIGQMHKTHIIPCQDYADKLVSCHDKRVAIALSDGCSTAGKTDFGSRYMVRRYLAEVDTKDCVYPDITFDELSKFALKPKDLFATLLAVRADATGIELCGYGDGVFAVNFHDGSSEIYDLEWEKNIPFYPVYATTLGKQIELIDSFVDAHAEVDKPFVYNITKIASNGQQEFKKELLDVFFGINGFSAGYFHAIKKIKSVSIFSDGIKLFLKHESESDRYNYVELIKQLTDFKSLNGDFVKRRVRRVMKELEKEGYMPMDDFSMATILVN